jgi:hypothetical protein
MSLFIGVMLPKPGTLWPQPKFTTEARSTNKGKSKTGAH